MTSNRRSTQAEKLKELLQIGNRKNDDIAQEIEEDEPIYTNYDIPKAQALSPLLNNQTTVEAQLQDQVSFYQNALMQLQKRSEEIGEENAKLYERMRHNAMQGHKQDIHFTDGRVLDMSELKSNIPTNDPGNLSDEMREMKQIYDAKSNHLQTLLSSSLKQLDEQQGEIQKLRREASFYKTPVKEGSLECAKCAESQRKTEREADMVSKMMDRLKTEREELAESLRVQQKLLDECHNRESDGYMQVKKSSELIEKMRLEKQELFLKLKQTKDDLTEYRDKYMQLLKDVQRRDEVFNATKKKEMENDIEHLSNKLEEHNTTLNALALQLEKSCRDKVSLKQECDKLKSNLHLQKSETSNIVDTAQKEVSNSLKARTIAEEELKQLKSNRKLHEKQMQKEVDHLNLELSALKRRLLNTEGSLAENQTQFQRLTQEFNSTKQELQSKQIENEKLLQTLNDLEGKLQRKGDSKDQQMSALLRDAEIRHVEVKEELTSVIDSQNDVIRKYKVECAELDGCLKREKMNFKRQLSELSSRVKTLASQLVESQQKAMHKDATIAEYMKDLKKLQDNLDQQNIQVAALMSKQNSLMQERHFLTKEIDLLKCQFEDENYVT